MNCHTFNNYSSDDVLFHVRGENGGTALYTGGILRKIEFEKLPPHKNVGFPAWHPGRRYIAFLPARVGRYSLVQVSKCWRCSTPEEIYYCMTHRLGKWSPTKDS